MELRAYPVARGERCPFWVVAARTVHRPRLSDTAAGCGTHVAVSADVRALIVTVVLFILILAAWHLTAHQSLPDAEQLSSLMAPHRHAWYALPLVIAAFVLLGLALVPVLLMIAATGAAFGPWLGPVYAMAGSLASASVGFGIGRWVGRERVAQLGGPRVARLTAALERNGTLAVFFLRKVPAPFTLTNLVVGASGVRYRDFLAGTLLGMGAFVIALAGFGYQMSRVLHDPSPGMVLLAAVFLTIPLTLAWFLNRKLRQRRGTATPNPLSREASRR